MRALEYFFRSVVSFKKVWLKVLTRAKKQNEDIFKYSEGSHSKYFQLRLSEKLVWKIWNKKWGKFKIFPNSFDQKSQKKCQMLFKKHIKNMWSLKRKVKVAILKSFFCLLNINNENKNWTKSKAFFYNVRNFFQKFVEFEKFKSNTKFYK
jgi:hypothetical protein